MQTVAKLAKHEAAGAPRGATQPSASGGLPPLRASTPAPSPAPSKRAPAPAPSKREPSLVILSRLIANAVPRPVRSARLKPPAPPPRSTSDAEVAARLKRRSADPTDYNVQVISAYATPSLPAQPGRGGAHATSPDTSWEADVALLTNSKARGRTLLVGIAIAIACLVALAIYWQ